MCEPVDVFNCFYTKFFNCNLCHVCKQLDGPLRVCSNCKTVVYCSKEHQKVDWKLHKEICSVISITNNKFDTCTIHTYEDFVEMKKKTFTCWRDLLNRELHSYELQMWMFPRVCELCFSKKVTTSCQKCHNICYCSEEHKTRHYEQHKKHCEELKLSLNLEIYEFRDELDRKEIVVNDFKDDINVLPDNLRSLMQLYDKTYSISQCETRNMVRKSDLVAPVASILYGLETSGLLQDRTFSKEDLTVHIVGADITEMAGFLWLVMSELPFHWIRNLRNLEYFIIGPDLQHNGTTDKFTKQLCENCKKKQSKTSCTFHTQLYHNIVDHLKKPDVVVCFNSGIHEYCNEPAKNQWKDSIPSLLKYSGVPLILTAYTSDEITKDVDLVKKNIRHVIIRNPHRNPFSNMRPLRNFESQHEPIYYVNGYMAVLAKK